MDAPAYSLSRRLVAEGVGTAFLLMAVVGGGIAAQRLSPDDVGLQLFEAAVVTAFALMMLIWSFGPISGAHFNPCVTLLDMAMGNRSAAEGAAYIGSQVAGGIVPGRYSPTSCSPSMPSSCRRQSGAAPGQLLGEVIATLGLMAVIFLIARPGAVEDLGFVAPAVGVYIGGGLLLHLVDQLRQPGGHHLPHVLRHLRRDRAWFRPGFHPDATHRGRDRAVAGPFPARAGRNERRV